MGSLFSGAPLGDPVRMALEYLETCKRLEDVATVKTVQAHVRYMIEFQWYVVLNVVWMLNEKRNARMIARVVRGIQNFGSR